MFKTKQKKGDYQKRIDDLRKTIADLLAQKGLDDAVKVLVDPDQRWLDHNLFANRAYKIFLRRHYLYQGIFQEIKKHDSFIVNQLKDIATRIALNEKELPELIADTISHSVLKDIKMYYGELSDNNTYIKHFKKQLKINYELSYKNVSGDPAEIKIPDDKNKYVFYQNLLATECTLRSGIYNTLGYAEIILQILDTQMSEQDEDTLSSVKVYINGIEKLLTDVLPKFFNNNPQYRPDDPPRPDAPPKLRRSENKTDEKSRNDAQEAYWAGIFNKESYVDLLISRSQSGTRISVSNDEAGLDTTSSNSGTFIENNSDDEAGLDTTSSNSGTFIENNSDDDTTPYQTNTFKLTAGYTSDTESDSVSDIESETPWYQINNSNAWGDPGCLHIKDNNTQPFSESTPTPPDSPATRRSAGHQTTTTAADSPAAKQSAGHQTATTAADSPAAKQPAGHQTATTAAVSPAPRQQVSTAAGICDKNGQSIKKEPEEMYNNISGQTRKSAVSTSINTLTVSPATRQPAGYQPAPTAADSPASRQQVPTAAGICDENWQSIKKELEKMRNNVSGQTRKSAVNTLINTLQDAVDHYNTNFNKEDFSEKAEKAINNAHQELENQPGWKPLLRKLAFWVVSIVSLGTVNLARMCFGKSPRFFTAPANEAVKRLRENEEAIRKLPEKGEASDAELPEDKSTDIENPHPTLA